MKARLGAAVVLDVQTGEVLAQASYPAYDAADPFDDDAPTAVDTSTGIAGRPRLGRTRRS